MRQMLQSLLEERFKLKMRKEQKEQPVYALVVAKGGETAEIEKAGKRLSGPPKRPANRMS